MPLLNQVDDPRDKARTTYESKAILFTRIISGVFMYSSMRKMTVGLNDGNTVHNVSFMLNQPELEVLPHYSTINNYLEKLDPNELQTIIQKILMRLIKMSEFKDGRFRNRYWQIIVDGVKLVETDEEHSVGALFKVHRNKEDKSIAWVEYYYYALEAKILLPNGIVISVCTVFAENDKELSPYDDDVEGEEKKKQDCEIKAFYRMQAELKKLFGNMNICLSMDSLYACEPVLEICMTNNWKYMIRLKEGRIKSVVKEFEKAVNNKPSNYQEFSSNGNKEKYEFINGVMYRGYHLSMVRYREEGRKHPFLFITNMPISKKNCADFVVRARARWKIENEGFNNQKNHGYELTHKFSLNYICVSLTHKIPKDI